MKSFLTAIVGRAKVINCQWIRCDGERYFHFLGPRLSDSPNGQPIEARVESLHCKTEESDGRLGPRRLQLRLQPREAHTFQGNYRMPACQPRLPTPDSTAPRFLRFFRLFRFSRSAVFADSTAPESPGRRRRLGEAGLSARLQFQSCSFP